MRNGALGIEQPIHWCMSVSQRSSPVTTVQFCDVTNLWILALVCFAHVCVWPASLESS